MNRFPRSWSMALAGALMTVAAHAGPAAAQDTPRETPSPPSQNPRDDRATDSERGIKTPPPIRRELKPKPKKAASPLDLVMKDGIPAHAEKRATLRDDLYALLATAANAKEAKKIARQIQRVWRTSGSDTVSVLMRRAGRAMKGKDQKLALKLLDSVVELAPDNAEAWNRRAFVHYASKNYHAAVGDLRRALALDKNHFKALDGLASIFQQIGDDAKALKVYEQLREIHPFWPGLDKAYDSLKGKVQGRGI